jgi:hypothetical protein
LELKFHHLIQTKNPIERFIREVRRITNAIGHFEDLSSADKNLFLVVSHINIDLLGNASASNFKLYIILGLNQAHKINNMNVMIAKTSVFILEFLL